MMSEHPELPDLIRKTGVPVPQVLDRSGETLAWKPAEDMAPKLDDLIEALGARATEQTLAEIKTLLGDGNQRVQLTGSKVEVARGTYDQALNVGAGGNTAVTVVPPAGELWRVKVLRMALAAPVGAGSGTHRLLICIGAGIVDCAVMDCTTAYNKAFGIVANTVTTTVDTKIPSDERGQRDALSSIVVTQAQPLVVYYLNNTNVVQSNTMALKLIREVEYIHA